MYFTFKIWSVFKEEDHKYKCAVYLNYVPNETDLKNI